MKRYYIGKVMLFLNGMTLVHPTKKTFMKKKYLSFGLILVTVIFTACNDGTTDTTTTSDSTTMTTDNDDNMSTTNSSMPLNAMDQEFVMKAAKGGMMEVEASNIAQENAQSQRVKDLATMIQRDHTNANAELKGFASSHGIIIPEDSLRMLNKPHLDEMRNMKGKTLDKHYIDMMMNAHNKDINEFEKASNNAADADLKAWAAKTLPVLKMHKDSVEAVSKSKM
jgi:putative membrane protein